MSAYQDVEYDKSRFTFIKKSMPIARLLEIVNETLAKENVPKTNHRTLNIEA